MKYCYNCRFYLSNDFIFCTKCGSSFDLKYCRKLHPNSARAEFCKVCGSPDLSTSHRRPTDKRISVIILIAVALLFVVVIPLVVVLRSLNVYDALPSNKLLLLMIAAAIILATASSFRKPR